MGQITYKTETITNAGATVSLDLEPGINLLNLDADSGSVTLVANLTVNFTGTVSDGQVVRVGWSTGFALNGQAFTINGITIDTLMTSKQGIIEFIYGDGAWNDIYTIPLTQTGALPGAILKDGDVALAKLVNLTSGEIIVGSAGNVPTAVPMSGDATIVAAGTVSIGAKKVTTAKINDKAVQILQMDDLTRGRGYVGDATNRPTAFDMRTALNLLMGNAAGTDPVMAPVTGDLTMSSPGVFRLASTVGAIFRADLTLSSAQILALFATPLEVIAAQGVGRTINVIDAVISQTFVTTAYTTNLKLELYTDTATVAQKELTCLDFTTTRITKMKEVVIAAAGNTQLIGNKSLKIRVATGAAAVGDGTAVVSVYFTILT